MRMLRERIAASMKIQVNRVRFLEFFLFQGFKKDVSLLVIEFCVRPHANLRFKATDGIPKKSIKPTLTIYFLCFFFAFFSLPFSTFLLLFSYALFSLSLQIFKAALNQARKWLTFLYSFSFSPPSRSERRKKWAVNLILTLLFYLRRRHFLPFNRKKSI